MQQQGAIQAAFLEAERSERDSELFEVDNLDHEEFREHEGELQLFELYGEGTG